MAQSQQVLLSSLSAEAHFALARIQALTAGSESEEAKRFAAAFVAGFGRYFHEAPRALWYGRFAKGLEELAERKIVTLKRDVEGGWEIVAFYEDRLDASRVLTFAT